MADILIRNGVIVDGDGGRPFKGDVAIRGDRIEEVGDLAGVEAGMIIEADERIIAPGFIDMHSHGDVLFANGSPMPHKVRQGVATELLGQDGYSAAPVTDESKGHLAAFFDHVAGQLTGGWHAWNTGGFCERVSTQRNQLNMMTLTGNANLRLAVIGHRMKTASSRELAQMCDLLDESLQQGSAGLSLGLIYPPSSYADLEELVALGRVLKRHDGLLVSHMRNEQGGILEALQEMIAIGEKSGCRIHISHLKCLGKASWGLMPRILEMMDGASARGVDISFDQYPYSASNTALSALLPGWALEGGFEGFRHTLQDADKRSQILQAVAENIESRGGSQAIVIAAVKSPSRQELTRHSVRDLSELFQAPVEEAVLKLLIEEELQVLAIYHAIQDSDIELAMMHHLQTVGSDGVLGSFPHPRAYGTFPRIIRTYSRDKRLFPLEVAVRKMTSRSADLLRLKERGRIRKGQFADLAVFRLEEFVDQATFAEPQHEATGLDWLLVNGEVLIEAGAITSRRPGRVLGGSRQ